MVEPDAQLVARARTGDRDAFATLVGRYERSAIATAWRLLRSTHDARDAAQEAFLTAYQKLNSLWRPSRFGPWLLRITRRAAHRQLRRRQLAHSTLQTLSQTTPTQADPDHGQSGDLLHLIARLPESERIIVSLRHIDGLDVASIAAATSRPLGTVTKQLSRAYARLRTWLKDEVPHA